MTSRYTSQPVPSAYTAEPRMQSVTSPYGDGPPMPTAATGTLFTLASGFGIGALVVLAAFMFLIGVGGVEQHATSPATPAAQSAANAPVAPGPAPRPAPNTGGAAGPQTTTGQAPAPADPQTQRAPTQQQQQQQR
jgi:hypothetical protein